MSNTILTKVGELMAAQQWDEVIRLLHEHETEVEADARLAGDLGWAYLKIEDCHAAVCWLERAVALRPESAKHRWALGVALNSADRLVEAERQFLRSLALKDSYLARSGLGFLYHRTGNLTEAEAVYKEGIRLVPTDGRRLGAYADFLSDIGRTEEAARYYQSARTAHSPDDNGDEN